MAYNQQQHQQQQGKLSFLSSSCASFYVLAASPYFKELVLSFVLFVKPMEKWNFSPSKAQINLLLYFAIASQASPNHTLFLSLCLDTTNGGGKHEFFPFFVGAAVATTQLSDDDFVIFK